MCITLPFEVNKGGGEGLGRIFSGWKTAKPACCQPSEPDFFGPLKTQMIPPGEV